MTDTPATMQAASEEQERVVWNRCDECGRFIAMADFGKGAVRYLVTPDSHFSRETWKTLCIEHARKEPT